MDHYINRYQKTNERLSTQQAKPNLSHKNKDAGLRNDLCQKMYLHGYCNKKIF